MWHVTRGYCMAPLKMSKTEKLMDLETDIMNNIPKFLQDLDKDEQLEDRLLIDSKLKDVKESLKAFNEPDEKEQTPAPKGVVKK